MFNVTDSVISDINTGRTWGMITGRGRVIVKPIFFLNGETQQVVKQKPSELRKLTRGEILQIYDLAHNSELEQRQIAEIFNIDRSTVSAIKVGKNNNFITLHRIDRTNAIKPYNFKKE